MLRATLALLVVSAAPAAAFAPCCALNGDGSAVMLGTGVLNAFAPPRDGGNSAPTGPAYSAPTALGVSKDGLFTTVLFGAATGPEDAVAGWILTSNATNDVIFTFANVSSITGPQCSAGVGPRGSMSSGYALCAGSGLFPDHDYDYTVAGMLVGVFAQAQGAKSESRFTLVLAAVSRLLCGVPHFLTLPCSFPTPLAVRFADESQCVPLALVGNASPFGTGAFAITLESGVPASPPASWSAPPSWCEGHWAASA
jgi:hypothetical protein